MERQDGKDPFDPATYVGPATIKSMIELRAFCAAFFDEHIRDSTTTTGRELLVKFFNLICHSTHLFARAQAVIPELQPSHMSQSEMKHMNSNVQRVLQVTEDLRRSSHTRFDNLAEESAWTKLAKNGEEQVKKEAERLAKETTKSEASGSASPLRSSIPASTPSFASPEQKNHRGGSVSPLRLNIPASTESVEAKGPTYSPVTPKMENTDGGDPQELPDKPSVIDSSRKLRPSKLENIPTFVPRAQMNNAHDLVWSPTSGTRQRKPEEDYERQSPKPAIVAEFGQEISGNVLRFVQPHPVLSSIKANTPEKRHGRGLSTSFMVDTEAYHSPTSPLAPTASPSSRPRSNTLSRQHVHSSRDTDLSSDTKSTSKRAVSDSVGQLRETESADAHAEKSFESDMSNPRHPVSDVSGSDGVEPVSAPAEIQSFGNSHITVGGLYEGANNPPYLVQARHEQYTAAEVPSFHPQPGQVPYHEANSPSFQFQSSQAPNYGRRSPSFKPPHIQERHGRSKHHNPSHRGARYPFLPPIQQQPFNHNYDNLHHGTAIPHQQMQQIPQGTPPNGSLIVPPPGSMHPVEYWDMLHQRELDIKHRLSNANIPITDIQSDYIARLGHARVSAIASKLPARGPRSAIAWLELLSKELEEVWLHHPGAMPLTPVIIARKKDYERAVQREIQLVEIELGMV